MEIAVSEEKRENFPFTQSVPEGGRDRDFPWHSVKVLGGRELYEPKERRGSHRWFAIDPNVRYAQLRV
ncbi:hypothetical protein K491DRAFT_198117 [Lophiostoma macrostomum CBS 122681]|uniref:Uncharacterized protein n=1 Tax=Lophiostoma macrostomum CBS 122681 TaxID=1314788 RepID=A0A6A6STK9_9PLEO|nr:hypothetical protein K491DRAFT_198117 [Lophiostoma macrostomum CBS 122681]